MPASQTTSRFVCPKGIRIDVEADSPRRKRKAASGLRGAKKKSKSPTVAVSRSSPAALCSPTKSSLSSPARNRRISRGRRCEPAREVKAEFVMEKETNKSRPTRRHSMPHFMICPGCKSNLEVPEKPVYLLCFTCGHTNLPRTPRPTKSLPAVNPLASLSRKPKTTGAPRRTHVKVKLTRSPNRPRSQSLTYSTYPRFQDPEFRFQPLRRDGLLSQCVGPAAPSAPRPWAAGAIFLVCLFLLFFGEYLMIWLLSVEWSEVKMGFESMCEWIRMVVGRSNSNLGGNNVFSGETFPHDSIG
ncbi:hypothetical protein AAMO2058_001618800 [Amorphochlora amoebiformis]